MSKLCVNPYKEPEHSVIRVIDGACIPFADGNTDYEAYLAWCKDNTPLPADEGVA